MVERGTIASLAGSGSISGTGNSSFNFENPSLNVNLGMGKHQFKYFLKTAFLKTRHMYVSVGSSLRECDKFKEEDPWFYIFLCVTDILLVLCSFMMLLLFVDWIVAPVWPTKV